MWKYDNQLIRNISRKSVCYSMRWTEMQYEYTNVIWESYNQHNVILLTWNATPDPFQFVRSVALRATAQTDQKKICLTFTRSHPGMYVPEQTQTHNIWPELQSTGSSFTYLYIYERLSSATTETNVVSLTDTCIHKFCQTHSSLALSIISVHGTQQKKYAMLNNSTWQTGDIDLFTYGYEWKQLVKPSAKCHPYRTVNVGKTQNITKQNK